MVVCIEDYAASRQAFWDTSRAQLVLLEHCTARSDAIMGILKAYNAPLQAHEVSADNLMSYYG